jgi:energy-coupling factor transporter transmembrane protein EcfT
MEEEVRIMSQAAKTNYILNLYPTTKLLFTLFIALSVFIVPTYWYAYAMLPVCLIIAIAAGQGKEFITLVRNGLLILLVFIFLMQAFFYPGAQILWQAGILKITQEGILYGLNMTSRILAIGSAFILFFRITSVKDFVYSLEKLGLPPKGAYVVLATLQIIPEMKKQTSVIMDAQKTRGVETEGTMMVRAKAFLPTISPLILSSLASTEERAITLESRAFSAPVKKTHLYEIYKTKHDTAVRIGMLVALLILIAGRILL